MLCGSCKRVWTVQGAIGAGGSGIEDGKVSSAEVLEKKMNCVGQVEPVKAVGICTGYHHTVCSSHFQLCLTFECLYD